MPASLRPPIQTSFGHLIRHATGATRFARLADGDRRRERKQLESRLASLHTSDSVSARPRGADQVRP